MRSTTASSRSGAPARRMCRSLKNTTRSGGFFSSGGRVTVSRRGSSFAA